MLMGVSLKCVTKHHKCSLYGFYLVDFSSEKSETRVSPPHDIFIWLLIRVLAKLGTDGFSLVIFGTKVSDSKEFCKKLIRKCNW